MAASRLVGRDRRLAIIWGVIGAIGLRVTFTAMFALLLNVPLLQLVGGVLLVWIAFKLVRPHTVDEGTVQAASTRFDAIRTIVMADVVMSLDNILAVGGASHGDLTLLLFGLALSMPLITVGSGFVASALDRFPVLIFLGAGVLAKVAGEMIAHDPYSHTILGASPALSWLESPVLGAPVLAWLLVVVVVAAGVVLRRLTVGEATLAAEAHAGAQGARDVAQEVAEVADEALVGGHDGGLRPGRRHDRDADERRHS